MSKTYQITYDIPIVYKNIPIDKKIVKAQSVLKITFSSTGWDIFTKKIDKREITIDLNNYETSENLNITNTKSLIKYNFTDVNIVDVNPIFFKLEFKKLMTKKIPIRLESKTNFADNFYFNKQTILKPDSIIVTSDIKVLKALKYIKTETIDILETDTLRKNIKLVIPEGVKTNIIETSAQFNIEEFAEKEFLIPINIENKPNGTDLVFYPEEIKLKCLIPFSYFEKIMASDFYISADFNNIEVSKGNTLELSIKEYPKSVKNIQLGKDKIEFIIYSN